MWDSFFYNLSLQLQELLTKTGHWFGDHLPNIVAILIGAWLVRRFGSRVIINILQRTVRSDLYPTKTDREKRIKTLDRLAIGIMRIGVYIIAGILIIGEINPSYTTALFASAGLVGAAVGFGAKDAINDFVSGIFIIIENQYRVGDVVSVSGVAGVVEDITIRATVLRDLDGKVHHVPNGKIGVTTNMTFESSNINTDVVVGYGTDIKQLEHVINHVGQEMAADAEIGSKLIDPPHFLRIDAFTDRGIVIKILGSTTPGEQWTVKGDLLRRLKVAFEHHQIEIPYPHIVTVPAKKA